MTFRAYRIHDNNGTAGLEDIALDMLSAGDVVIRVHYSSVNYKDALAGTGKGKILRQFPLNGGVDASGIVESSTHPDFSAGDKVLVTGYGLSQDHDGGYADYLRVPSDWVIPLPAGLSLFEAMAIGTAGFTAALALYRMELNGQQPSLGPVVVTGATGGVGSIAIDLLTQCGYEVTAATGKENLQDYLRSLGATEILPRLQPEDTMPALMTARWGGAIDSVGGATLSLLTRTVKPWGSIASIGLAGGSTLETTVMPFILRGVSLLGITSANCAGDIRRLLWSRLATHWRPRHLDSIVTNTITLAELPAQFTRLLSGERFGRVVVKIA